MIMDRHGQKVTDFILLYNISKSTGGAYVYLDEIFTFNLSETEMDPRTKRHSSLLLSKSTGCAHLNRGQRIERTS